MDKFDDFIKQKQLEFRHFLESSSRDDRELSESLSRRWKQETFYKTANGQRYYVIPTDDPLFSVFKDVAVALDVSSFPGYFGAPAHQTIQERILLAHKHDFFELFYLYQGSCTVTVEGHSLHLTEGSLCIYNLQTLHTICLDSPYCAGINILIQKSSVQPLLLSVGNEIQPLFDFFIRSLYQPKTDQPCMLFEDLKGSSAEESIKRITLCYYQEASSRSMIVRAQLICLMAELATQNFSDFHDRSIGTGQLDIVNVIRYLEQNYDSATLESTAENFHYSTRFMSGFIRQNTGCSFLDIIRRIRLENARRLLTLSTLSADRIAEIVGYKDRSYLDRVFKQQYGVTAAQYRHRDPQEALDRLFA